MEKTIVEFFDPLGDQFGFTLRWTYGRDDQDECSPHSAKLEAFAVAAIGVENDQLTDEPQYEAKNGNGFVKDIDESHPCLEIGFKRDGCLNWECCPDHWCSDRDWKKYLALLQEVYDRAHKIFFGIGIEERTEEHCNERWGIWWQ